MTDLKKCSKCGNSIPISTKFWHKKGRGLSSVCKKCKKAYDQQRVLTALQAKNKKKYDQEYQEKNKNRFEKYHKAYNKSYYNNNIEKLTRYNHEYKKANREYKKKRRSTDISYALRTNISRAIRSALQKEESILAFLPYSIQELKLHLESKFEYWMNWNNYGIYLKDEWNDNDFLTWKWQIDHIIPQSKFTYDSMSHINFEKCWCLENLRPLSAKQNILKGAKIGDEF